MSKPNFTGTENDFSIQIGNNLIPFYDTIVYLSSYRDENVNKDAIGPYWARIIESTKNHIRINFLGYGTDFDVFLHKDDLPELEYKFHLPDSLIYENLDNNRIIIKDIIESAENRKLTTDESYLEHNNILFASYWNKEGSLTEDFGISPEIITRLTVYDEWNSPAPPFFVESKGTGVPHPGMEQYVISTKKSSTVEGSRGQWKSVNVLGDGNCMFRAVANDLHLIQTGQEWGYQNNEQDVIQEKLRKDAVLWLCDPAHHNMIFATMVDVRGGTHNIDVRRQIIDSAMEHGFIEEKREPLPSDPPKTWQEYNEWTERAIKAYCENKRKDGNLGRNYWGTDLELFALANIYNVGINVYFRDADDTFKKSYDDYKRRFSPVEGPVNGEVNIYWKGRNHYHALYPNRK